MNRINHYVLNGAIALLSTAGLVACSSSDDVTDAPVNPTYDGKSVKTQFAINIATPSNGKTRMSAVNTQNNNNYLGMTNVRLLTLADVPGDDKSLLSALNLADPTTEFSASKSSHIYKDVNIPLTTSNFLFYSTRKDLGTSITKKAETGAIVSELFTNTNLKVANTKDISFKSEPILSSTNSITTEQNAFAAYLNKVVGTQVNENNKWSNADVNTTLGQAYKNFIKTYTTAQRAGSANAVRLQMQALYNIAKPIAENSEATDQALAQELCKNILNLSTTTVANSIEFTVANGELNYLGSVDKKISNFPCEQGLPEGAALLTLNGSSFAYNTTNPEIGGSNKIKMLDITYPLPIVYFDNTPAKANTAEISTWQTTTNGWDADNTWNGWTNEVSATTRSIALKNNINYGVAALKTVVKCEAAALEDNRHAHNSDLGNQSISVPTDGFEVTGILIGGQPNTVNWQFINTSTDADSRKYVVYDKVTNGVKAKASSSSYSTDAIYTLVFDNWILGNTQEKVTFALELQNGDVEFYGQEGVIAQGQKFYLIGQLNPSTGSINWPTYPDPSTTNSTLPESYKDRYPVKANIDRVFVQDFTTTARVNIKSLKNAYVTIPDLRATKLQLGLSVDLTWQTGLTYDVNIE